jgi:hypothetical protein
MARLLGPLQEAEFVSERCCLLRPHRRGGTVGWPGEADGGIAHEEHWSPGGWVKFQLAPPEGWAKFPLAPQPRVVSVWEGLEVRGQKQGKETRKWRGVVDESRSEGSPGSR